MAGRARTASGTHTIDRASITADRRRKLAEDGYRDGRWSYSMLLAALELAASPDAPDSDEAWCELLDNLEPAMTSAVIRACKPSCDPFSGTG